MRTFAVAPAAPACPAWGCGPGRGVAADADDGQRPKTATPSVRLAVLHMGLIAAAAADSRGSASGAAAAPGWPAGRARGAGRESAIVLRCGRRRRPSAQLLREKHLLDLEGHRALRGRSGRWRPPAACGRAGRRLQAVAGVICRFDRHTAPPAISSLSQRDAACPRDESSSWPAGPPGSPGPPGSKPTMTHARSSRL